MKRIVVLLLALAMVLALFAGCQPAAPAEEADAPAEEPAEEVVDKADEETVGSEEEVEKEEAKEGEGEKVYVNDTAVLNLDWWAGIGTDSKFECPYRDLQSLYPHMLWGTLLKMDPYDVTNVNSAIMDLAESLEISDDGLLYTFVIRDDIVWTDGTPFTAEDVEFSLTANLKIVHSMYAASMASITGATAVADGEADTVSGINVDGNTLTIALDLPYTDIAMKIFAVLQILPKHLLGEVDPLEFEDYLDFWTHPIGTGPWMIDEVSFPNYFTMVQNPDWYGEPVNIQNITSTSHITGGVEATLADLIAGNIDFAFGNGVNDIVQAENVVANNPEIQIFTRPSSYQRFFVFNQEGSNDGYMNEFMGDKLVRQAIGLLIDKVAIASMYGNTATPLKTAVLPTSSWYNTDIPEFERDVDAAKALLDEAGYDYSQAIRLVYYYNEQTTKDIMDIVVQNFADVGVTVAPFLATGDLGAILYDVRNWDIMYGGYLTANPIYIYDMLLAAKAYTKYMGDDEFRAEVFDPMFAEFCAEGDPVVRKALGDEIQVWALENSYQVPIYGLSRLTLVNSQKLEFDLQWFTTDEKEGADFQWETWNLIDYQ